MAPEQATGADLDRRADVFSAGVMIWETLAGKRLFKGETEAATLSRVLNEPIPELVRVAPGATKQVSQAVMRALERNPARRYSTCAQLAEALEAATAGGGVASSRDVAVFVKAMLGEEIDKQREAVRTWLARSEPSQVQGSPPPSSPSSVSAAAMSFPGEEYSRSRTGSAVIGIEAPRRSRAPLVLSLLLLVPLAGGGGFWFARNRAAAQAPHSAASPPVVAAPVLPSSTPPEPTPGPTAAASAEPTEVPAEASTATENAPAVITAAPRAAPRRAAPKKKEAAEDDLDVRNPYR
jgi:serine/threonine-protein kinase